ncbi:MAG: hypothetical protein H6817_12090 [Phycisphaerales bacterium]|nr:hypothetical protein [Phycisphaerales bacterium]
MLTTSRRQAHSLCVAVVAVLITCGSVAFAGAPTGQIEIVLTREFILEYKDRATIDTCMFVDHSQKRPNSPRQGGALRFAGRSDVVELAAVGFIINARDARDAVKHVNEFEGDACVELTGAWRLWCQPGPAQTFRLGDKQRPQKSFDPPHVFEVHPIVKVEQVDLDATWKTTRGYPLTSPWQAIEAYKDTPCHIRVNTDDTISITTPGTPYDYSQFIIEVLGDGPEIMTDGVALYASVHDTKGRLIERKNRLVFVEGTTAESLARSAKSGDRFRVTAVPRMSLKLIQWRIENADDPAQPLNWHLPYEFVVVEAKPL